MSDEIQHPNHYTQYKYEVIELTGRCDFCVGNVFKYLLRAPFKGTREQDLRKAVQYLRFIINGYNTLWTHPSVGCPKHNVRMAHLFAESFGNKHVSDVAAIVFAKEDKPDEFIARLENIAKEIEEEI